MKPEKTNCPQIYHKAKKLPQIFLKFTIRQTNCPQVYKKARQRKQLKEGEKCKESTPFNVSFYLSIFLHAQVSVYIDTMDFKSFKIGQ